MRAVKRRDPNTEIRVKIFEKVSEILGYEKYMPGSIGGMLGKKIKESSMTMEEIYEAIIKNEQYLKGITLENFKAACDLLQKKCSNSNDIEKKYVYPNLSFLYSVAYIKIYLFYYA